MTGFHRALFAFLAVTCTTGTVIADAIPDDSRYTIHSFQKIQLTDKFWTEGVAMGDLNGDKHMDIVAWPYWYEGPAFQKRHKIAPATQIFTRRNADGIEEKVEGYEGALGRKNQYSVVNFTSVHDFNHDGWPDIVAIFRPIGEQGQVWWYENPGRQTIGGGGLWARHIVFDSVNCENPEFGDLLGGQPGVLCIYGDVVGYARPDRTNPHKPWSLHVVSDPLSAFRELRKKFRKIRGDKPWIGNHGLGYGDVDGNGRLDVMESEGWWEHPVTVHGDAAWKFRKWPFLPKRPQIDESSGDLEASGEFWQAIRQSYRWPFALSGAQIYAYDVNDDGLPDIISSLDAHRYGLAWFEQCRERDSSGKIRFKPHILMEGSFCANKYGVRFSQPHAVALADIDGDGLKDIVTGKRFWAHGRDGGGIDPDSNDPAVLYWFKLVRTPDKGVDFIPYLIDDDSGMGYQIAIGDLNGDGLADIATANKKGTFAFLQKVKMASKEEWAKAQPPIECP